MKREILFRGKRIDNGEWVFGDLSQYTGPEPDAIEICFPIRVEDEDFNLHDDFDYAQVDPATVGQYTGLKDKNGQRIFEGDIFQCKDARGYVCFGTYPSAYESRETHVGFYIKWIIDTMLRIDLAFWANEREIEVIGNIHDNPELMEA